MDVKGSYRCRCKVVMTMLWTIAGILLALWFFGMLTGNLLDGLLHVLVVLAAIAAVIQLVTNRHTVRR